MELIMISEAKLKVMLEPDEMDDLLLHDIYRKNTKEAISLILLEAKRRCGFDTAGGRIFVQMYPGRRGGCELFVTKLALRGSVSMLRSGADRMLTEFRKTDPEIRYRSGYVIYAFREMQYLLSTCACLLSSDYGGGSSAWYDPAGIYYLSLEQETCFAGEHFGRLCPSSMYYYIHEHCRLISENAVLQLGVLA